MTHALVIADVDLCAWLSSMVLHEMHVDRSEKIDYVSMLFLFL